MFDSVRSRGLQPTRLLCPWDFQGKSTGVGCHCLLRSLASINWVLQKLPNTSILTSHLSPFYCLPWRINFQIYMTDHINPLLKNWQYICFNATLSNHPTLSFPRLSFQLSSVTQSCLSLCSPMSCSTPGLPVQHQLLEPTQTHVHWVGDAIQPSQPLLSPSSPALNISQHQGFFKWVSSSHQVAKVWEFQLQHQTFQWTPRTDLL